MSYTSSSLVVLASIEWMQDNGFDYKSILYQAEVSGNSINSWLNSLLPVGMTEKICSDYIAKILGL